VTPTGRKVCFRGRFSKIFKNPVCDSRPHCGWMQGAQVVGAVGSLTNHSAISRGQCPCTHLANSVSITVLDNTSYLEGIQYVKPLLITQPCLLRSSFLPVAMPHNNPQLVMRQAKICHPLALRIPSQESLWAKGPSSGGKVNVSRSTSWLIVALYPPLPFLSASHHSGNPFKLPCSARSPQSSCPDCIYLIPMSLSPQDQENHIPSRADSRIASDQSYRLGINQFSCHIVLLYCVNLYCVFPLMTILKTETHDPRIITLARLKLVDISQRPQ
jgi:hypothetical protein